MSNETKPGAVDSILAIWQNWDRGGIVCADDAMVMMRPHMEIIAATIAALRQDANHKEGQA
jgi:hypothetical protein